MKRCDEAMEEMQGALDAKIKPRGVLALDSHTADCPECSDLWEAMQRVDEMLHDPCMVPAPSQLPVIIMNQIRVEGRYNAKTRKVKPWPLVFVAAIGTVLLTWWGMLLAGGIPVLRSDEFTVISGGVLVMLDGIAMLARALVGVLGVTSPAVRALGLSAGIAALLVFTLGLATSLRRASMRT